MGNPHWIERLRDGLDEVAGEDIRRRVLDGSEDVASTSEADKARWTKRMLDRLDQLVPDEDTRYDIMTRCSCECALPLIEGFREEYRRSRDIDALLEKMYRNPFYVRPVREGSTIFFTKCARDSERYEKAQTEEERRRCYCHCDYIRGTTEQVSPTHCYCAAGWYKGIWEGILERPVRVTMVKSIQQGDDVCQFAVELG